MGRGSARETDKVGRTDPVERELVAKHVAEEIMDEALLVQAARSGDLKSYSALVELYQERALHIAFSFVGHWEDAKDMAQEAFVKAYQNLANFHGESRFYTWFYRILANTCKDFLRKKKIRGAFLLWTKSDKDPETDILDRIPACGKNASQTLENKELGTEIQNALNKLPFQQRTAFALRYLEGMRLEEIAGTMALSEGAVKAHLWQAGQKLRKILKGAGVAGGSHHE